MYAIRDGVVVSSVDLVGYEPRIGVQNGYYSYGRVIKIAHPGTPGVMTYAHLSKRSVTTGQHVKAGQLIGLSGETGHDWPTPAHRLQRRGKRHPVVGRCPCGQPARRAVAPGERLGETQAVARSRHRLPS